MQNQKNRKQDNLSLGLSSTLIEHFAWINDIQRNRSTLPSAEMYSFSFSLMLKENDNRMQELETFIRELFEVKKHRAAVLFCWRHTGLVLFVFKAR